MTTTSGLRTPARRAFAVLAAAVAVSSSQPAVAATGVAVAPTETVLGREFGVDLHLDNCCSGNYGDLASVISQIEYIGARRVRDWADVDTQLTAWRRVHNATGARFHASIPEASPMRQLAALDRIARWLKSDPGLIEVIEGGNEEDDAYAVSQGASLGQATALQQQVAALGRTYGVAVAQLSVGANWYPPLYDGDYMLFGKPPADLGNAHVYMNANSPPLISLIRIGALAAFSVPGKAVDVTEFGIYQKLGQSDAVTSGYMAEAPFDAYALGYAGLFVYALHDDSSGATSFYTRQGYKRPFADYWHAMTRLLADPAGRMLPTKTLALSFTGHASGIAPLGIKNLPMYKSDGSLWIAAYDEERANSGAAEETIRLDRNYPRVTVIDGQTGATTAEYYSTAGVTLSLPPNHVLFVEAR